MVAPTEDCWVSQTLQPKLQEKDAQTNNLRYTEQKKNRFLWTALFLLLDII